MVKEEGKVELQRWQGGREWGVEGDGIQIGGGEGERRGEGDG